MPELPFQSAMMTLTDSNGTVIASDLACILDPANVPWNMEVQGMNPTDWFDLQSLFWTTPIPQRSNYFVDQATGVKYSVFGLLAPYIDHLEVRVSKPSGAN
jgi:hypothetical protein